MAGAAKNRQQKERKNGNGNGNSEKKSSTTSSGSDSSPKSDQPSPARYDGNRDPARPAGGAPLPVTGVAPLINRNVDMGVIATAMAAGFTPTDLPTRPKILNKTGKDVVIKLNVFGVLQYPSKPVYQYDVLVGNGAEKRALIKKCWNSKAVQAKLGGGWIFDGNKIAWSMSQIESTVIQIDLDAEEQKPARKDKKTGEPKPDIKTVQIRPARNDSPRADNRFKIVDFAQLRSYLESRSKLDISALEAINFLDHLMRETPSRKLIPIKRQFYSKEQNRTVLGAGIEAFRGVYASIRPVHTGAAPNLAVNVDVANTAFWIENVLVSTVQDLLGVRDPNQLAQRLRPGQDGKMPQREVGILRRLKRVKFTVNHQPKKVHTITGFMDKNATNHEIDDKTDGKRKNIQQYFLSKYNIRLSQPYLPLVRTMKPEVVFPMELCTIAPAQRYNFKLSDIQTTNMLKFAVTEPDQRWQSIEQGLRFLNWGNDIYLQKYGLSISDRAVTVKAKVLPPPKVAFRQGSRDSPIAPGTSGRWDLKGDKKFLKGNPEPLRVWGVCVVSGRGEATRENTERFIKLLVDTYQRHGGQVAQAQPHLIKGENDAAKAVEATWLQTGNHFKSRPQLLVFIVPDKDSQRYIRIKKSCDCRYGVVSQVLQAQQVMKCNAQYAANVCLKINAKLGGITAQALGIKSPRSWFTKPTMIIGADVTHGAPVAAGGTHNAQTENTSIAAMTMSWDREAIKYVAGCQTNGQRVEMIAQDTLNKILRPMVNQWTKIVSGGVLPQHLIYMRDGVSEGQYAQVLQQEVADMKEMFKAINPKSDVKFTVLVATKRHHIRFFPQSGGGDRKNNPLPGTLVETGCTNPFEYDFYLCSHSAIKGTARPVHYHVLMDEAHMGVEDLQNMIYEGSYQYVRSTTPISMFPAIYYAHLAAARATAHLDAPSVSSGPEDKTRQSSELDAETKPLLPLKPEGGLQGTMWFV